MTEGLHDPRRIQEALEPHATRLRLKKCERCGAEPGDEDDDDEGDFDLYVLPTSNSVHATPQLAPLCETCAMMIAEALGEIGMPTDDDKDDEAADDASDEHEIR